MFRTIVGSRRRQPRPTNPRGLITTLDEGGSLRGTLCFGNTAGGEFIVEDDAVRWRRGHCR